MSETGNTPCCSLLYARVLHKVLTTSARIDDRAFQRLVIQGMILGQDKPEDVQERGDRRAIRYEIIEEYGGIPSAALRDVHGPARSQQSVEHERG